ncbi:killer cell lectin-like receptor 2 [Zalophus californianus]|uniref:Killer cell lectin-like receptor 2 n=1 Tax=Zalophus californianus TaxID=9704 RepID=A0A6J2D435_ZALCA|nr:killer cell lectin-like receptor 2 [Zalophus californianus]XP_027450515.1 killer cell lectin-like receptor 2 [Zalophus californianus]XP_027450516.1 killer cell lectin-like receptor 2 [Zalophus californianus]XP_035577680.1 killer cell lectin-like receptor 2 [Zalophus californianus]
MSEERVTYVELKLPHSREQKDKRRPMDKRREFPWYTVALTLGVICFLLLLTITGLGFMFFQKCFAHTMQDMNNTKEKSASLGEAEDHSILLPITDKDYDSFQGSWYCCGKSCYYFSKEEETWERSKKSCEDLRSSLIKIDNKEEQNIIQSKIKYNYWIGLHKTGAKTSWKWLDGTLLSQMVNFQQSLMDVKCGHLKSSKIFTADCSKPFRYICEKEFTGPDY